MFMLENEDITSIIGISATEDNKLFGVINQKGDFNIYNIHN